MYSHDCSNCENHYLIHLDDFPCILDGCRANPELTTVGDIYFYQCLNDNGDCQVYVEKKTLWVKIKKLWRRIVQCLKRQ
jgi:hypothetical protein